MGKAGAETGAAGQKMIPADCVSVLLMALGNTSITKAQYDMMSALDGSRTASSFEHQFRSITAKAKELKTRTENGEQFIAVQSLKKRSAAAAVDDMTPPATPKKQKAAEKPKAIVKPRGKKAKGSNVDSLSNSPSNEFAKNDEDFFNEFNGIIKSENAWDKI